MRRYGWTTFLALVLCLAIGAAAAAAQATPSASAVVTKATKAVGYQVGGGATKVDLKGTELMAQANGEARVEARAERRPSRSR